MDNSSIARIVPVAKRQGLLKPEKNPNVCFTACLNQANFLLYLLAAASENGLSTSQIGHKSKLNLNTCKTYLRELCRIKMVRRSRTANQEAIWYLMENQEE